MPKASGTGINRWWSGAPLERFLLEITSRSDIGSDLNAPRTKEDGKPHYGYSLVNEVRDGEIVFHYDGNEKAIVGHSRVRGRPFEDEVVWAARGPSARKAGVTPYTRPGWRAELVDFKPVVSHITLAQLREREGEIQAIRAHLKQEYDGTLYLPFELSRKRPLRPLPAYMTKLPAAVVELFPKLKEAHEGTGKPGPLGPENEFTRLLQRMRRGNPIYKPAALLIALDLLESGAARSGVIDMTIFKQRFGLLVEGVQEGASGRWWEPFFHLQNDGFWDLYLQDTPSSFDDLARGRPKGGEGSVVRRADRAVLAPEFRSCLRKQDEIRRARSAVAELLRGDDAPEAVALLERIRLPVHGGLSYADAPEPGQIMSSYSEASESVLLRDVDPFTRDPEAIRRALNAHAATQNALARWLEQQGIEPRGPGRKELLFDLAWTVGRTTFVAEVKSLTDMNQERQLRLAVGQVLRYRQSLEALGHNSVRAAIVAEHMPLDPGWASLCEALGIVLAAPPKFTTRLIQP